MQLKASPPIYQLKITLIDIEPPIWRMIQVPSTILLCCLHDALQAVFGWTDSHLHSFEKDKKHWGVPDYDDLIDESKVQLAKLLKAEGDSMIYVYDFGDDWRHEVVLEKVVPANDLIKTPTCLDGARRCPPEDVGGVSGYEELLEVIFDPTHEEYEHLVGWAGGHFQAEEFDLKTVNKTPKALERKENRVFFDKWCQQTFVKLGWLPGAEFWNGQNIAEFLTDLESVKL